MTGRFSGALHKSNLTKMLLNEIDREYPRKRAGADSYIVNTAL